MTDEAPVDVAPRDLRALLLIGFYSGAWLIVAVVLNLGIAALVLVVLAAQGGLGDLLNNPLTVIDAIKNTTITGPVMAVSLIFQFPAMYGLAELIRYFGNRGILTTPGPAWAEVYAWRRVAPAMVVVPALMGLTAGWLPGWIAGQLRELLPILDFGAVGMVNAALTTGPVWARLVIAFGVMVGAPVVEELVFRGFMWWALERALGGGVALVGSSLLFAAYHMDPIQATALLFTAFALGWVRRVTGSVAPGMAMHAVNNTLGVVGALVTAEDADMPMVWVVSTAVITVALCGLLWRVAPREA